jgi:hypothetical protein
VKESPFEHLPRRSFFVDDRAKPVNAKMACAQKTPLEVSCAQPEPERLAAARAIIASVPNKGGRPKLSSEDAAAADERRKAKNAERMAAKRKTHLPTL